MTIDFNSQNNRKAPSKEHISKRIQLAKNRVASGFLLKPGTYLRYMAYLRTKPLTGATENHHILPKHMEGSDDRSNLIKISIRDHILAHLLLFLEEGGSGNLIAYALRHSSQHVDLKSQGKRIDFMNQLTNKGRYNSKVQRTLGLKGGSIGGLRNTQAQWNARSKVGQTYGRLTGVSNQSEALKNTLQTTLIFEHKAAPGLQILVPKQEIGKDIAVYLNEQCDSLGVSDLKLDLNKVSKGGAFYDLLKNKKKSLYGWSITGRFNLEAFDD